MEYNTANMENKDIQSLLQWYLDSGVDESTGDEALNWFALSSPNVPKTAAPAKATPTVSVEQITQEAEQLASACDTLSTLNEAIANFEGCRLKKTATHTVFSDGNPQSDIMLIGEAPGVDEDRQGKPFVGESGQLLDRMFKAINLNREKDFYIANILPWRPPGNRNPTPEEIAICMPFIKRHIELFDPKLMILLGGVSTTNLLNSTTGITRLRGKWIEYGLEDRKVPVLPLLHPAYLLRQPKSKKDTWADLLQIKTKFEELSR